LISVKNIITVIAILYCNCIFSQDVALFQNNAYGRPLYLTSNRAIEGSPYFSDDYQLAQVTAMNGTVYNNIKIKLNIAENIVQYQTTDGKEMIAGMPLKRILFGNSDKVDPANTVLESIEGPINKEGAVIYQVLDSGKISLLKKIAISYRDDQKYGEATVTRIYDRKEFYYFQKQNEKEQKLEKGKAAVLALFEDKKDKILAFVDHYHLDFKTEASYQSIFNFYNNINYN